ncbi:MAG: autotransporter outer membrane beta-barrel domain-containing protein [Betaproteobacteria bacterium]
MQLKNVIRAVAATAFLMLSSLAAAFITPTVPITLSQPGNSPGLNNTFINGPAADTVYALGNGVSNFVGGGPSGNAGLNVNRYALGRGTGAAAAPGAPQWNVWGAYSHSNVGYDYAPLSSAGNVKIYLAGVDYTFSNHVVFGVATAFDHMSTDLNFSAGKLDGSGYTISPYVGMLINKNISLDATIGYGRSDIDTATSGVTGSTHSDRTIGALGLTYRQAIGAWTLTGRGALLGVHNKLGSYTLSDGSSVADSTSNLAQIRLMGQAAYTYKQFTPYVSIAYINDINRPDQAPILGIPASNDRDGWRPAVGIRFRAENTIYGGVQYSSERGRSQITNNMFLFNVGIRF